MIWIAEAIETFAKKWHRIPNAVVFAGNSCQPPPPPPHAATTDRAYYPSVALLDFLKSVREVDLQQGDGGWKTEKESSQVSTSNSNGMVWLWRGEAGVLFSFPNLDTVPAGKGGGGRPLFLYIYDDGRDLADCE
jgi:hypothetical protein